MYVSELDDHFAIFEDLLDLERRLLSSFHALYANSLLHVHVKCLETAETDNNLKTQLQLGRPRNVVNNTHASTVISLLLTCYALIPSRLQLGGPTTTRRRTPKACGSDERGRRGE